MAREIEGLAEVVARLRDLPAEVASKNGGPLRKAIYKAAKVVRDEARVLVPYDEQSQDKHLRDQIVMKRDPNPRAIDNAAERYIIAVKHKTKKYTNNRRNRRKGRVGEKYMAFGDFYYWIPVEFGTSKMKPRSFMAKAFETKKDELGGLIRDELSKAIDQVVRRMNRR